MSGSAAGNADGGRHGDRRRSLLWVLVWTLAAAAAFALARTEQRVQHDAAFCTSSCHHAVTPAPGTRGAPGIHLEGWAASGHEKVECQACHAIPVQIGVTLFWQSLVKKSEVVPHAKAAARTCTRMKPWRAQCGNMNAAGRAGVVACVAIAVTLLLWRFQ